MGKKQRVKSRGGRKRVDQLIQEIKQLHVQCVTAERKFTKRAVTLGAKLNDLKKLVKKPGDKWEPFLKKNFPDLHIRSAQLYMKISNATDLDSYPMLASLTLDTLHGLAKEAKNGDVGEWLIEEGLSAEIMKGPDSGDEIKIKVGELMSAKRKNKSKGRNKSEPPKKPEEPPPPKGSGAKALNKSIGSLSKLIEGVLEEKRRLRKVNIKKTKRLINVLKALVKEADAQSRQ